MWAAFGKLAHILKNMDILINLESKLLDLTVGSANKPRVTQSVMKQAMINISFRGQIRNKEIKGDNQNQGYHEGNSGQKVEMGWSRSQTERQQMDTKNITMETS